MIKRFGKLQEWLAECFSVGARTIVLHEGLFLWQLRHLLGPPGSRAITREPFQPLFRYLLAVLIPAIATAVSAFFHFHSEDTLAFMFQFLSVLIVVWIGGIGPSVVALVCSLLMSFIFLLPNSAGIQAYVTPLSTLRLTLVLFVESLMIYISLHAKSSSNLASVAQQESGRQLVISKTAEKAAKDSEEKYKFLAESIPQMVWITDSYGKMEYVNKAWFDFVGIDPVTLPSTEDQNRLLFNHIHDEDWQEAYERWEYSLRTKEPYECEYRFRESHGECRWFLSRAEPMFDERGNVLTWFGTCTDVHNQKTLSIELTKAKEAAESANHAKDQFIAVLSHELRTPLAPVLAVLDGLLRFNSMDSSAHSDLRMVRRNIELEIGLIDDLLDITRINRGKVRLNCREVDMHELVQNVFSLCKDNASRKSLQFDQHLGANSFYVFGDAARLQQVLWNIINNSIKFTPNHGGVSIVTSSDEKGFSVSVSDTGIGIEPHVFPRLFKPFEQGEYKVGSSGSGGLGLGLSIAKSLIEMQDGTIEAISEGYYRGSTFKIELPHIVPEPDAPKAEPNANVEKKWDARILLVEDHADTRESMAKLLNLDGYQVQTADCVKDAIRLLHSQAFDLLISDIGLPDGTGHDLMLKIRADRNPVKGIVLSGFGRDKDIQKSQEAGFLTHITKPVNLDVLTRAIDLALA